MPDDPDCNCVEINKDDFVFAPIITDIKTDIDIEQNFLTNIDIDL